MAKGTSNAIGNKLSRMDLAAKGAKAHAAALPKEAGPIAKELEAVHSAASQLNAEQEKLKAQLKKSTEVLNAKLKQGGELRGKLVRYAEATFGPRSPEMLQFRPATEGKKK